MGARDNKSVMQHSEPIGYVNSAAPASPELAEGTRRDVSVQRAKGMSIATRCNDVEHFVATFHRYVEDSTIFIPNARREVGTVLPFSFDLVNEESVLVGLGSVLEELTTANNRFGRAGIVLSIQKLKRESIAVMERMRAARKAHIEQQNTPAPVFARAMTAPIAIDEVLKARSTRNFEVQVPKKPLEVQIPSPMPKIDTAKLRSKTVLGIPAIGKSPAKQPIMQIPVIPPRGELPKRPAIVPDATPPSHAAAVDAVPETLQPHDTVRDEFPFALRHELRILEQRAQPAPQPVAAAAEIDDGWDDDAPVAAAPAPAPAPVAAAPAPMAAAPAPAPAPIVEKPNLEHTPGAMALAALQALCEQTPSLSALASLGGVESILGPIPIEPPVQSPDDFAATPEPEERYESAASRAPTVAEETIQEPIEDAPANDNDNVVAEARYSVPMDIPVEASEASEVQTLPKGPLSYQTPIVAPLTTRRPLRWVAQIAIMLTVFVATAAIVASIDVPSIEVAAPPAPESASAIEQPAAMPERIVPMAVDSTPPVEAAPVEEAAPRQITAPAPRAAVEPVRRPATPAKSVKRPRTARKCNDLDCL